MRTSDISVGYCENGAGYGGAIISLAAYLEAKPAGIRPYIYTELGTDEYRRLTNLGTWRQLAAPSRIAPARIRNSKLPFSSMIDNICNIAPYAFSYYRTFKRDRIQIAYLNNDPGCNLAAALGAKLAGIPFLLHARGFSADTRGNRWVLSNMGHCIAVSNAVKAQLLELGLHADKCTVVPEGLDLKVFSPRAPSATYFTQLNIDAASPIITLVGGLIDWKGQDILLDACPMIIERFPNATILLVGSAYGKDRNFADLISRRAAAPDLNGNVRLLGSRSDIADILSISSVVLHTSTRPEPFGRTFLEGMAMGKPVIASNEGGPSEVITHEVDGLLIEPRNPRALASAVIRVLSDPSSSGRMGTNAALKARSYSIENHVAGIQGVLGLMTKRLR